MARWSGLPVMLPRTCSMAGVFSMSRSIDGAAFRAMRESAAQATVEAALTIPAFLTVLLLALQPVCALYTRAVMEAAAEETARIMVTAEGASDDGARAFAQRRLAAVPDLSIFHTGGPLAWDIELERAGSTGGEVSVSIEGALRPLPVIGVFARTLGETNGWGDVVLRVEARHQGRPEWLEGSYETWAARWN